MIRKARAVWYGTRRGRRDGLSSDSGVFANVPYSLRTQFGSERGINPEEPIAAAHAGCNAPPNISWTMVIAAQPRRRAYISHPE
jgi:organic hydroperoxide reductase OsmC/OhrA